jgi:hypothetical protein
MKMKEKVVRPSDDRSAFLAEFVSILPKARIPTQIEALIDRDL